MTTFNKSYLLALLMICMPIVVHFIQPGQKLADSKTSLNLEDAIPLQFADWKIDAKDFSQYTATSRVSNYDQLLNRTYINSQGEKIQLTIAYGSEQTHDLKVHQQETCYKAQGFNIQELLHSNLQIHDLDIPITQMYATRKDRNEHVTYWFTIGNSVIAGRVERFFTVLKYLFSGYIADGFLIRISNTSPKLDEISYVKHQKFILDLIAALPDTTTDRLIGR
ncbi:exosortase C-terminal domain/associated protein EpsI [Methylomonas sp. AM2-LC]|uniref:exosortase C-terminal domain/associated protein EpsI n=1 Tax=Methylomonas sp. AM2-LC TaxID=3153301 RepID=UPI0032677B90